MRVQVEHDRVKLMQVYRRRWWQFWKPQYSSQCLAEEPCRVREGATVQLLQWGEKFMVTVDGTLVLKWLPEEQP